MLCVSLSKQFPDDTIYNLDALTYAGNLENLSDVATAKNYEFLKEILQMQLFVDELFDTYRFDKVIHLAAESHVDRSIERPFSLCED